MQLEYDEYSQLRAGLGYCICKKQTTDLFISGGVLLFPA